MHHPILRSSDWFHSKLPHVVLTSDVDWDPNIMDNELELEAWIDAQMELDNLLGGQ